MIRTLEALLVLSPAPRRRLAAAVALGALTVVFGVGLMALAGYLISRAAERPAILSLMVVIVGVRFFGLGRPIVRYLERLASHDVALRVLGRVRRRFYEQIEPLAPAGLGCYRHGDLLSRMVADVDALQDLYLRGLEPPLVAVLAGAVAVGAATAVLPAAGLVLAGGLLTGGCVVPALGGALAARAGRRTAPARGDLAAELVELVGGAAELVAFGAEPVRLARVSAADRTLVQLARRDALATGMGDGLIVVVTGLTVGGVVALAVAASGAGRLDRVFIAVLPLLVLAAFEAVTPLVAAARALSATLAAGRRILELSAQTPAIRDPARPAPPPRWPFAVALEDLRAGYPNEPHPVLDGISLRLEPGERVALIGPSGSGKTTVVNLLLRFLDPEQGRVTVGGRDLREYRQVDVRRMFALAGQESHLFSATIRDNLLVAHPAATDAELERALGRARIGEWVARLPAGLDTVVGEQGRALSGGQRQRIVLARALLAHAPVLVLDEPTAHLDTGTAEEFIGDVLAAADGRTVLLITHRPEGLGLVDQVLSLSPARAPSASSAMEGVPA